MTPEKKTKEAIKKLLKDIGAWFYMPVPTGFGGASLDFLVCYKGRFYGIEAKSETGKATPRQSCVMHDIARAGGGVCLENSTGCENVKWMLRL